MAASQQVFRVRRNYNKWVANQTLEDYALRFTSKRARRWTIGRVANTALGAISFLALEAIGGAITLNYGFTNAAAAIIVVSLLIFLAGIPICYYAARYGVDIDLLTRGAGFGYIGSTITSLIYASFTFIFFALEAAIMAMALDAWLGIPLTIGYLISSVVVIPLVTHGITLISRFQLLSQPIWVFLQLLPFAYIAMNDSGAFAAWMDYEPHSDSDGHFSLLMFGAASAVVFSLVAQIGEQVDFLRFLPEDRGESRLRWWVALISAGPGWIVIGLVKMLAGSFLAWLALSHGVDESLATDPTRMYAVAFTYVSNNPEISLAIASIFVIISQIKINVTNAYAGSIAWSNFFSRLTHSHPGRVVWLVFNVAIALLLTELGIYRAIEEILGMYAIVAIAWVGALVADLVINKPLGLSPSYIEFKRAHLYDINPVGVGAMLTASFVGIASYVGWFGIYAQSLAPFLSLLASLVTAPIIAIVTRGRFYIARRPDRFFQDNAGSAVCCICEHEFEHEDIAWCPAYAGPICSLCCSLDARCLDVCKSKSRISDQVYAFFSSFLPHRIIEGVQSRIGQFVVFFLLFNFIIGGLLYLVNFQFTLDHNQSEHLIAGVLWRVFFVQMIITGVVTWLLILAHESRHVAQEESTRQTYLLMDEIVAHEKTDQALQKAKEVAEAANQAKSRYLTGISHELRTPLNAVMGYAQLLDEDNTIPENRRNAVRVIRRSSEHLADIMEGLLDISKIEAGRLELYRDKVQIRALLDQIVHMFRLQAHARGVEFWFSVAPSLPQVVIADEKRLRQILINLLSNALKFTERGRVSFEVKYRNQVAEFIISDTGIGIPVEDQERIFRPFERVRRPGMPHIPGTGLGLTITRLLTEIMGGDLDLSSEPGKGSCFRASLMLSSVFHAQPSPRVEQRIRGHSGSPRNIMIVDDDPTHRGLMADLLGPLGFSVIEAADADTCEALARECHVDLFLLDVSMPGTDGYTLAQRLRESYNDSRIIMVSANARELNADNKDTVSSHDDYITKPVRINILLERIGALLDITWVDETPDDTMTRAIKASDHYADPATLKETLKDLYALAEIGHVSGLRAKLQQISTGTLLAPAVLNRITRMLDDLDLNGLRNLLQELAA